MTKHALPREESFVEIEGHRIRVKAAAAAGIGTNRSVEWDDVAAAAAALDRPAKQVLDEAMRLAGELGDS